MSVELRRITDNDLEQLMNWRNDPAISKYMFTDVKLNMDMQRAWFAKYKNDDSQIRWIVWVDDVPVGSLYVTNIDHKNFNGEFGVFIARKELVDLKTLLTLHWSMYEYIYTHTEINHLYAYNMEGNEAVTRLSRAHGCKVEGKLIQHVYKYGRFHDVNIVGITKEQWNEFKKTINFESYKVENKEQ